MSTEHNQSPEPMDFASADNFVISMLRLENSYLRAKVEELARRRNMVDEVQPSERPTAAPFRYFAN